ncbi:hypothetical protein HPB51_018647 [Rhipicephalus microplus]|uniref:Brinker DNA-binding domain-containing protein n=1 Tax=Rhipicephalus microplus TaxID=6941 RepID=A0A9J6F7S1_RHIMP|nr:hypothetical protein HPB51_018647 [Rhipicephalus microplus]
MSAVGSKNTRRSFTAAFKRAAILHAEETNNCAAGRKFGIGECVVRKWRLQREEIFSCDSKRRGFRGPKSGRFSELEAKLAAYSHLTTTCCGTAAAMTAAAPARTTPATMNSPPQPRE